MNDTKKTTKAKTTSATIFGLLVTSVVCFFFGIHFYLKYSSKGFIHIGKGVGGYIDVTGNDAIFNIRAFFVGALTTFLAALVLAIKMIIQKVKSYRANKPLEPIH